MAGQDLDLDEGILVVRVKGGDVTARRLRRWLVVHPSEEGVRAVFVSLGGETPGQPVTLSGLRVILRRLGLAVGVEE